jgi:hypothetical protein
MAGRLPDLLHRRCHDIRKVRDSTTEIYTRDSMKKRKAGKLTPAVRLTARGKPRKRNPAPGEPVVVRLQPHELALLDAWTVEQDDIPETRQDAIRRLIAMVCGTPN